MQNSLLSTGMKSFTPAMKAGTSQKDDSQAGAQPIVWLLSAGHSSVLKGCITYYLQFLGSKVSEGP